MSQIRLNLIAAASINGGIGIEGRLPWQIKKDLSFFKNITCATVDKGKKNAVIMGRKTWFSFPQKVRPLQNRVNIILSREMSECPRGAYLRQSLQEAIDLVTTGELSSGVESVFIIGGSSVYKEAMMLDNVAARFYLTRVLRDFECDTFLDDPADYGFHKVNDFEGISDEVLTENGISFKFEVHEKSNSECINR